MTPADQFDLLSDVTYLLVDGLPAGWQRVAVDYAVAGAAVSLRAVVDTAPFTPARAVSPLLARLRAGMAVDGRRWHAVSLVIEPSLRFNAEYRWH